MEPNKQVRLDELLPAFVRLSPNVQIFLARYLSNGQDKIEAVSVSHQQCKTPAVLGCQILARARVRHILNAYEQRSAVEATLVNVERLIKRARRNGTRMKTLIVPLERLIKVLERISASQESA
jgi:hypothetical protein